MRPGDGYEVPELDWDTPPGEPKTRGPKTGITGMLPPLPSVIRETVAEQPEAAAAALNALMSKRELRVLTAARLQQAQDEQEPPLLNREASEQEDDTLFALEAELVRLIGVYRNLFSAVRPGEASTEARVQAQGFRFRQRIRDDGTVRQMALVLEQLSVQAHQRANGWRDELIRRQRLATEAGNVSVIQGEVEPPGLVLRGHRARDGGPRRRGAVQRGHGCSASACPGGSSPQPPSARPQTRPCRASGQPPYAGTGAGECGRYWRVERDAGACCAARGSRTAYRSGPATTLESRPAGGCAGHAGNGRSSVNSGVILSASLGGLIPVSWSAGISSSAASHALNRRTAS